MRKRRIKGKTSLQRALIMDNFTLKKIKASSVALGTFDGLHTGHRSVIEKAVDCRSSEVPLILMFNEHPLLYLCGNAPKRLITKNHEIALLKEMGITPVYVDFPSLMNLSCEDFIVSITRKLGINQISCGFNYHFGKNAEGDTMTLKQLCDDNGIRLKVAGAVMYEDLPVSSSRIRDALEKGNVISASNMLGRHFSYDFPVQESRKLGRELGFPTINQHFPNDFIIPKFGVYASYALVKKRFYPSVTNIGLRPTVSDGVLGSETHIIGINETLYGENIRVALTERLRDEIKFASLEELKNRIRSDREKALRLWEEYDGKTD